MNNSQTTPIQTIRDIHWSWNRWLKDLQEMEQTPAVQLHIKVAKRRIKLLQERAAALREAQS